MRITMAANKNKKDRHAPCLADVAKRANVTTKITAEERVLRQGITNPEASNPTHAQDSLVDALKVLFDLLEDYAPPWYTQEHHDRVCNALSGAGKHSSPSTVRRTPKQQKAA